MNQNDISAWQRWIAPMPAFFKPIFYIAMAIMSANAFFLLIDMHLLNFEIERPEWFSKLSGWIATGAAIVSKFTVDFKKMQEEKALDGFDASKNPLSFKSMDDYLDPNKKSISRSPLSEIITYSSIVQLTKIELHEKLTFWKTQLNYQPHANGVNYSRYSQNVKMLETRIFDLDRMISRDLNKSKS